jgi:hypothetical protein
MAVIVCNTWIQHDVSKKPELNSECICFHEFPEWHFEHNKTEGAASTTFLVELLENFPRLTHTDLRGDFQQSQNSRY